MPPPSLPDISGLSLSGYLSSAPFPGPAPAGPLPVWLVIPLPPSLCLSLSDLPFPALSQSPQEHHGARGEELRLTSLEPMQECWRGTRGY